MTQREVWLDAVQSTLASYRKMIDAAVGQLSDEQFFARPASGMNSVAVILRHLGGNLRSRWTQFLAEDGEKPDRNRDAEFEDWPGTRAALMDYFDGGWRCLSQTLGTLQDEDLAHTVTIRGESHSVPLAIQRSISHTAYHVGQLLLIARLIRADDASWRWLTIPPRQSQQHNEKTWGTAASRGAAGS